MVYGNKVCENHGSWKFHRGDDIIVIIKIDVSIFVEKIYPKIFLINGCGELLWMNTIYDEHFVRFKILKLIKLKIYQISMEK